MLSLSRKGQTGATRETSHLRRIMSTTHNVKRIIVGALLAGSVALAGLGLSMGTAQTRSRSRRARSVASMRNLTRRPRYRHRG